MEFLPDFEKCKQCTHDLFGDCEIEEDREQLDCPEFVSIFDF